MVQFLPGARLPHCGTPVVVATIEHAGDPGLCGLRVELTMDPAGGSLEFRSGNAAFAGGVSQLIYTPAQCRAAGDDWELGRASPHASLMRKLSFTMTDLQTGEILAVELPVLAGTETSGDGKAAVIIIESPSPCPLSVVDRAQLPDKGRLTLAYPRNAVEGLAALRNAMDILPAELRSTLLDGAPLGSAYVIGLMDRAASVSGFGSGLAVTLPLPSLILFAPLLGAGTGNPASPEGILGVPARLAWTRSPASAIAAPAPSRPWKASLPAGSPAAQLLRRPARGFSPRRVH